MTVPDYLKPTVDLLTRAYPDGPDEAEYPALLRLMHDHISARNLADAIYLYTDRDHDTVYNDAIGGSSLAVDPDVLAAVEARLNQCGFERWKADG